MRSEIGMTSPFNDEAARLIALDKYPGRKWEDLTEGEQEQARQSVTELRRILGESVQDEPNEGH